jgi:hypothetical protein
MLIFFHNKFTLKKYSKTISNSLSFNSGTFVFQKVISEKLFFKFFCICLLLKKLVNEKHFPVNGKHFPVKEKFDLISRKIFSFYFRRKILSGSCEKIRNIILFADYIKFDPQTFD